ncbi:helix-turn-helix domain-containing protein [Rhizobium sp. CRIBSB]|nr:helix-turn-helix domain-containing protein [Rhizobium sp. CRIBSB]
MSSDGSGKPGVTALARGLTILQCFDRPGVELTVSEIARRVALSQPTAWRLCQTLLDKGFLVTAPNGAALRVGAPALTLGYAAIQGLDLPAIVRPYMQQLTARVRATVSLSLFTGTEILSVDQTVGDFVLPGQPVGWRASLASSASGLSVLSILPDDERQVAMEAIARRKPESWPRRQERIARAAMQFAKTGYVIFADMLNGQYAAAATSIIEGQGASRRYWAISCSGLSSTWTAEALEPVGADLKRIRDLVQPAASVIQATAAGQVQGGLD